MVLMEVRAEAQVLNQLIQEEQEHKEIVVAELDMEIMAETKLVLVILEEVEEQEQLEQIV